MYLPRLIQFIRFFVHLLWWEGPFKFPRQFVFTCHIFSPTLYLILKYSRKLAGRSMNPALTCSFLIMQTRRELVQIWRRRRDGSKHCGRWGVEEPVLGRRVHVRGRRVWRALLIGECLGGSVRTRSRKKPKLLAGARVVVKFLLRLLVKQENCLPVSYRAEVDSALR
jgi:hypothetical protein